MTKVVLTKSLKSGFLPDFLFEFKGSGHKNNRDVSGERPTQSLEQSKSAHRTLIMNLAQLYSYWLESRTNLRKDQLEVWDNDI